MAQWLWSHRMIFILIIVLEGLVLSHLEKKHRKDGRCVAPGLEYFWALMKQGRRDGVIVIALTALALLSALLAGAAYLLAETPGVAVPGGATPGR